MNRQERRAQARRKAPGMTHADVLARQRIGRQTLHMAMEDEAVKLAADILCQRQLWAVIVTLNERYQFGPKRTRDFFEAMESVLDDFEQMKKDNGDAYAEEKLRQRAEQVSGIKIRYQHEAVLEKMREAGVESTIIGTVDGSPSKQKEVSDNG
jgi:hypothetical protein